MHWSSRQKPQYQYYRSSSPTQNVVFWPLDDIELVDWTTTNKFARLWFCEDIHHSSILKLAIKKQFRNLPIGIFQASCLKIIQTMKKSVCWVCVFTQKGHTVDILPYSQLCCFPYWFSEEHNCDMHPYITESHYVKYAGSITSAYAIDNIVMCHHFPPSSPITLLEKNFA